MLAVFFTKKPNSQATQASFDYEMLEHLSGRTSKESGVFVGPLTPLFPSLCPIPLICPSANNPSSFTTSTCLEHSFEMFISHCVQSKPCFFRVCILDGSSLFKKISALRWSERHFFLCPLSWFCFEFKLTRSSFSFLSSCHMANMPF